MYFKVEKWMGYNSKSTIDVDSYHNNNFILHQMKAGDNFLQAETKLPKTKHLIANLP